jgi:hypothetical protein
MMRLSVQLLTLIAAIGWGGPTAPRDAEALVRAQPAPANVEQLPIADTSTTAAAKSRSDALAADA